MLNVPAVVFLPYVAQWFIASDNNPVGYFSLLFLGSANYFLVKTATTNPGYLPQQYSPFTQGPIANSAVEPLDFNNFPTVDVVCGGSLQRLKYCATCQLYRPPRTSHCVFCDLCVEVFDHHCPWVGNCVGKRNYRYFLSFITSVLALAIFDFSVCLSQFVEVAAESNGSSTDAFVHALEDATFAFAMLLYAAASIGLLSFLVGFHLILLFEGQTTAEKLKRTWSKGYLNTHVKSFWSSLTRICAKQPRPHHIQLKYHISLESFIELQVQDSWNVEPQRRHSEDLSSERAFLGKDSQSPSTV
jgi:hypothetical protein